MSDLIKYNKASYLFAKHQIIPDVDKIESKIGDTLTVTEVCDRAAKILFSELDNYKEMDFNRKFSFHVLSSFSKQLKKTGRAEFGTHDLLKMIPEKDLDV